MYGTDYKTYNIDTNSGPKSFRFIVSRYTEGGQGLYVGVEELAEWGWESCADITTNVEQVPYVTLDVGHIDQEAADSYLAPFIELMEDENLIDRSHLTVDRGYKKYEMVHFPEEILTKALIVDNGLRNDLRLDGTYFHPEDDNWSMSDELKKSLDEAKRSKAMQSIDSMSQNIEDEKADEETKEV